MERSTTRRLRGPVRSGRATATALALVAAGSACYLIPTRKALPLRERLPGAAVRRVSFDASVMASGVAQSSQQTVVKCQLENLRLRSSGVSYFVGGASTILDIIPNGTTVKKGDVLCSLDASEYEELVRVQAIRVEQHRAEMIQTDQQLQAAELALKEYREGLVGQNVQGMQGRVALAEAGLKTASDRLAWSERMVAKGYASPAQVATDRAAVLRATHERSQARTDLDNFRLYRSETTIASLKAAYETAHWWSIHETGDYHKAQDLLDHYRDLVGHCTIRAPHDGFVIYANGSFRAEEDRWRIEQGAAVRQGQELFYFPDLSKMEILAMLHETVVDRIRPGMPARVRVEGLRGPATGGHVELVESFPKRSVIGEVPYYPCRITLDVTPAGLLPAMSAEVEIQVGRCRDVLAVPTEAVGVDHGRNFCDVIGPSGRERREVTAGGSSSELIGVVAGLEEGETVVLNPEGVSDEHQPEE